MGKKYLTFRVDEVVKDAYMSLPSEWKRVVRDYVSLAVLAVARELKERQEARAQPAPPAQPVQPAQTPPQ